MAEQNVLGTPGEVPCSYHPKTMTLLRCSRCGKPICPQCAVRTPVGLRCPECAGVRGLPTYPTASGDMAKAVLLGFVVAMGIGVVWGFLPNWGFYLALALGFGVAEAMAWAAGQKRGLDLQIAGWVAVIVGVLVSRSVLAARLDYTWDELNAMNRFVEARMHLQIFPDGLIALIPLVIVFIRFR